MKDLNLLVQKVGIASGLSISEIIHIGFFIKGKDNLFGKI